MIENSSDKKFIQMDQRNNPLMTLKTLKFYCEKQSLPSQPQLNQVLYLQYKGFQKIIPQTISLYINLKTLHLNNNGIRKIQGLHMLRELNNLYLNNNFIEKIYGLEDLYHLKVLNLAHNKLDHVQGVEHLEHLRNLNLAENFFTKSKDLEGLIPLTSLTQLNLSQNQIEATEQAFQTITELENLTILYLKGTPLCNLFKNYRKRLIYKLKKLKFLDNRPVLPADHQLAEAWMQGGTQKQTELKSKLIDSKRLQQSREQQDQNIKGQEKIKQQTQKLSHPQPIIYEKSLKPADDSGLNSAYLPKKKTNLQKFLDGQVASSSNPNQPLLQKQPESKSQIITKVQSILGSQKPADQQQEDQIKLQRAIKKKWNKKYEKLLQQLLLKYKFDFSQAQPSFNMIVSNINKRLMKPVVRFEIQELRCVWTEVEKDRRVEEKKAISQKTISSKQKQQRNNKQEIAHQYSQSVDNQ